SAQPELLRQAERHAEGHRAEIVFLAAERVAAHRVARSDTGALKPAQIVTADKETVLNKHLLAIPTQNIACFAADAQHPFRRDRVIIARIHLVTNIIYTKPDTSKVVSDRSIIARRRFESVISAIVEKHLAKFRSRMLSSL